VTWLDPVTAQQFSTLLLFDEFRQDSARYLRQLDIAQTTARNDLLYQVAKRRRVIVAHVTLTGRRDEVREAVGDHGGRVGAFLGDDRLNQTPEAVSITSALRFDKVEEQVCSRHVPLPQSCASVRNS